MSLPNQPEWACPEWGPDHFWHDCEVCIEQYELFIEKAQGGWIEDEPAERPKGEERQIPPIEAGQRADENEKVVTKRVSISAYCSWEPTNLG